MVVYIPTTRTITLNMSKLAGQTTARWFDPTSGRYVDVVDSPLANTGNRQFKPPGFNGDGDGDWVLVMEAPTGH